MRRHPGIDRLYWAENWTGPLFLFFLLLSGTNGSLGWGAEIPYPTKPINMVFCYAPGGPHDIGSRAVADKIGQVLGQPLISVYKPGGGGTLGTSFVARSKPDGYTILIGSSSALVLSPIVKKVDYKLGDFESLGIFGESVMWIAVRADARWKTLKDFVEESGRSPGRLKISSFGKLSSSDFVIELLSRQAKIKLTHVPYKSTPEALTAVLGGHTDAAMVIAQGGLIESGSIRILALAGDQRWEDFPQVPTFKECGYPIEYSTWISLCLPKETPKDIVNKLCSAQKKALEIYRNQIKEQLRNVQIRAVFLNPQESMTEFRKQHELTLQIANELGVVAK